jgi:ParB family chromosome partitioning protein
LPVDPNEQQTIIREIPLKRIIPDPEQPRKHVNIESLNELAESIKTHGLLQPILVRSNGDGTYVIVHGERRFRAHQIAQLLTIKCIVSDMDDTEAKDAQVIENLIREDLSDMELAREFQRRADAGATHGQIAKAVGKSRAFVTQHLGLLRLPEKRQEQLEKGEITFADARLMAASNNTSNTQMGNACDGDGQHGYAVTMENLEVYKLFQKTNKPDLATLHAAYRKDLAIIRRALL